MKRRHIGTNCEAEAVVLGKGIRYPADPPTIEEIVAVMRCAGDGLDGRRPRGLRKQ